ncbi:MAG: hypothetical protein K6G60_07310 [Lachnospiraceae bacterium]|nr:hypothetical protein [Lachnospiraceae bacterium]
MMPTVFYGLSDDVTVKVVVINSSGISDHFFKESVGRIIDVFYHIVCRSNTPFSEFPLPHFLDDLDRVIRKEKYIVNGDVQKKEVKRSVAQASDVIECTYDALG